MTNLKKNFGYQLLYRILAVITPLITAPIVSRALGAEKLGVYSATYAFVSYFMFASLLGIEKYGQRTIATARTAEEKQRLFWEIYSVQAVASVVSSAVYFAAVALFGGERTAIMLIQSLWLLSCLLGIGWFFFGCGEFKVTATRSLVVRTITVICVVLFIRRPEDLLLYTLIMAGGTAASNLVLWLSLRRYIGFARPAFERVKVHIRPIFRLFIPVIALSVYHVMDKSMLDLLSTEANVGWYYAVDKIVNIPLGLIMALGTVMMTRMSYALNNEEKGRATALLGKSSELTMFLTCAVTFGIAAVSIEFIPFFFGPGYEPCVRLMYIFLPVLVIKALGDVVRTQYLIPSRKDNLYTAAVISGAVTNLVFNALLIPSRGAEGAVLGTLAAEGVVFAVQVWGCRNEVRFLRLFFGHIVYLFIGAAMLIAVRVFAGAVSIPGVLVKILSMVVVGAFVYLALCGVLWLVRKNSIFSVFLRGALGKIARTGKDRR